MDFDLALVSRPPEADVTIVGDLDIATTPLVARRLNAEIAAGCRTMRIDLSGVTFVDASALGMFTLTKKALRDHQGTLEFVAYQPGFLRLCRATGLLDHFGLPGPSRSPAPI